MKGSTPCAVDEGFHQFRCCRMSLRGYNQSIPCKCQHALFITVLNYLFMTLAVGVLLAVTKLFCASLSNIKNKLIVDIEDTRLT